MVTSAKFRSRARVIDLLGRQQIGDSPTAIGELFKNSLDAAATKITVNYEEEHQLLQITDDGLGMRPDDVTDKWLVLATDSSLNRSKEDDGWKKHSSKQEKEWLDEPTYGEKGIGRLSIAMLGRLTLLWSVWGKGEDKIGTLCLVHWHLFQHPGMLFDDLSIPMLDLKSAPTTEDVQSLFDELKEDKIIEQLIEDEDWDENLRVELKKDIHTAWSDLHAATKLDFRRGTSFVSLETGDNVEALFEARKNKLQAGAEYSPDYLKSYHAFSTFWDPFHRTRKRPFEIEVLLSGKKETSLSRYWHPNDFRDCDHHIKIEITKDGFAKGYIKNYNEKKETPYQIQLQSPPKGHYSPGPFLLEIGYAQGKSNTWLPDDLHKEINDRLTNSGGFSIYLNKVRIQPYGSIENDFANFEYRRSKNAGRYYFSSRRMFGGVFLPSKSQTGLREKAGREGFIANGAMRGLRLWLEEIFIDIADQHLGSKADRKDKKKAKEKKAKDSAEKRLKVERDQYLEKVKLAKGWLNDFQMKVSNEVASCRKHLSAESNAPPGKHLNDCEISIERLREHQDDLTSSTPSGAPDGVVLEGDILEDVDSYLTKRAKFQRDIQTQINKLQKSLKPLTDRARSQEDNIKSIITTQSQKSRKLRENIESAMKPAFQKAKQLDVDLHNFVEREFDNLEKVRDTYLDNLSPKSIVEDKTGGKLEVFEKSLSLQTTELEQEVMPRITRLVSELEHLTDHSSKSVLLSDQGKTIEKLKERLTFLSEMAQLGLVLESANHEYENQVLHVRAGIRSLRKKLNSNDSKTLDTISDSFEIIDQRIRLFDPLVRRRSPNRDQLTGKDIKEFIARRIKLDTPNTYHVEYTKAFEAVKWNKVQRPIILGAMHNIFLNALYWSKQSDGQGYIRFSAIGDAIVISDSGPGVIARDQGRLFEPGFTRRPYGRGLGLYVAKQALLGIGFSFTYSETPELGALDGANFVIKPIN